MDAKKVVVKPNNIAQEFEVIGQGKPPVEPCEINGWWVVPADQWTHGIPQKNQDDWDKFKARNIPVVTYLILDDMRDHVLRLEKAAEQERKIELERIEAEQKQLELEMAMREAERQLRIREANEQQRQIAIREAEKQREQERYQAEILRQKAEEQRRKNEKATEEALEVVGTILKVAGVAALVVGGGIAVLATGALFAGVAAVGTAIRLCPVIVAVLPDGRWISISSWWTDEEETK